MRFSNLERIKEGMGDQVSFLIQYVSQFSTGLLLALVLDWRLTLITTERGLLVASKENAAFTISLNTVALR